jgi:hypothetical protein
MGTGKERRAKSTDRVIIRMHASAFIEFRILISQASRLSDSQANTLLQFGIYLY